MNYKEQTISAGKRHYYSSSQGPFHNANNIYMFYGGGERGQIVDTLIRSLRIEGELITVHGERGSGKTMLSLVLADRLKHRYNTIRYDHSQLSAALLLRHLLIELNPLGAELISAEQAAIGADVKSLSTAAERLTSALKSPPLADKPYVLTVDSSADIDDRSLQLLLDLASVRVEGKPVIYIVLFRRVEDDVAPSVSSHAVINRPDNHYWLRRLSLAEIAEYLHHHMMLFDFNRRDMFTREMSYFFADRSEGVFRSINNLARNAFLIASLEDETQVSMSHLLTAGFPSSHAAESVRPCFLSRHRRGVIAILGSSVAVSIAALVLFLQ